MRFLIDRCAGRRLAVWLQDQGHDVAEARERGPDPGDLELLRWAADEQRILVTLDKDFGALVFLHGERSCGLIRLPDVLSGERVRLLSLVMEGFTEALAAGAVITVRGERIRVSYPPGP
jgi:predicted nuclease of predicted toxin-antitoxin system